jgi:hypothetical protein
MLYLAQNQPNKIPELLGDKYDMKILYPQRKVFHVSEMLALYSLLGSYYCDLEKINEANMFLDTIKKIAPKSEDVEALEERIAEKQLFLNLKKSRLY